MGYIALSRNITIDDVIDLLRERAWLIHVFALLVYLLAAAILTFPLAAHFTTQFPSQPNQDVFLFLWNNWWIHRSIIELHTKPYVTDYIMAPFVIDLRLGTLGLLYGLLCLPFFSLLGPIVTLNVQVLATAALNGYAAFRLTLYLTRDARSAFLAGLVLTSIPAITFHLASGRPSCAALWPAIFTLYYVLRLLDRRDNRTAAWLAVFLIATLFADQQAAMFCAFWLLFLTIHAAISRRPDLFNRGFLVRACLVAAIAAIPAYYLYYNSFGRTLGYTVPGAIEAYNYSVPVSFLWNPSALWRTYGAVLPLALILGVGLLRRVPSLARWVWGSIVFVVLTFGPVAKGTNIPLLFSVVRRLPTMAQFRAPYRFQIPAAIGLAVTLGIVMSWSLTKLSPRRARILFVAVLLVLTGDLFAHRAVAGFPTQAMEHDPVYSVIGRDNRDCLLLEVPVGVRTGTDRIGPGEALSFHQPVHRKRLINGSTSRLPLAALEYYRSSPAIMFLAGERPPPGDVFADLQRRIVELKVGYVVVHPAMLQSEYLARVVDLLQRTPQLRRMDSTQELIVFRVDP